MTPPPSAPRGTRGRGSPEKKVEKAGDELMATFGFTAIRFSQARATMQTRGIPDRRYYRPAMGGVKHPRTLWWEAKADTKQSVHQRGFQELVTNCGEIYVCGGVEVLEQYLCAIGLARRVAGGLEGIRQTKVVA